MSDKYNYPTSINVNKSRCFIHNNQYPLCYPPISSLPMTLSQLRNRRGERGQRGEWVHMRRSWIWSTAGGEKWPGSSCAPPDWISRISESAARSGASLNNVRSLYAILQCFQDDPMITMQFFKVKMEFQFFRFPISVSAHTPLG